MIHLLLLIVCILSIEIFLRCNFLFYLESILKVTNNIIQILTNKKISDHWKEFVIPSYALNIMKLSLQILLILLCIMSMFLITDIFVENFVVYISSWIGIFESIIFAFAYVYLRRLLTR